VLTHSKSIATNATAILWNASAKNPIATSANGKSYPLISPLMASINASAIYLLSTAIALTACAGNANANKKRMMTTKMTNTTGRTKSSNSPPGVMLI